MSDYDFKTLDDKEFEILCADVIGGSLSVRFERFKRGKDKGVDARYLASSGEVILQCKHWANTPVEQLIRHLKNDERNKLLKLHPTKYLLAVSNRLSRTDKAAIRQSMDPFIASDDDIFGNEDLNDLLSKQPATERRHYKLWLTSSSVLSHIINKPIFERSNFSIEEARASISRYVQTSNHLLALEMLERLHIVIITGEPGIGKTTLAEHLCLKYVCDGFEFVKLSADIREVEAIFDTGTPKIFYFDDFLGRNYLEALSGHEGNEIFSFMQRVKRDPTKRFILTSRSTILNQGKALIDNFRNKNSEKNEFELKISSLSELDRARILYSHIWHSNLDAQYVDELYREKRYRTVIDHDNYNPRLIEFITDSTRLEACTPDAYWSHICNTLKNPADIWDNAFDAQQDDFGRAIVLLTTLSGRSIGQDELAEAYSRFVSMPQNHAMGGRRDFLFNLRHLTGSLLSRLVAGGSSSKTFVRLFNPSIGDFVLRRYASDLPTLRSAFGSLRSLNSLQTLASLKKNEILPSRSYNEILQDLLDRAVTGGFVGFRAEYVATLAINIISADSRSASDNALVSALAFVKGETPAGHFLYSARFLRWGRQRRLVDDPAVHRFIEDARDQNASKEEIEVMFALCDMLPAGEARKAASGIVSEAAVEYLSENSDSEIDDDDVFGELDGYDLDEGKDKLRDMVEKWLDDIGAEYSWLDVRDVIETFDIESRMDDWFKSNYGGPAVDLGNGAADIGRLGKDIDEVDDLFDRS